MRLWDPAPAAAGAPLPMSQRLRRLNGVAFSPDGKLLATAAAAGYVRIWNAATRQPSAFRSSRSPTAA